MLMLHLGIGNENGSVGRMNFSINFSLSRLLVATAQLLVPGFLPPVLRANNEFNQNKKLLFAKTKHHFGPEN